MKDILIEQRYQLDDAVSNYFNDLDDEIPQEKALDDLRTSSNLTYPLGYDLWSIVSGGLLITQVLAPCRIDAEEFASRLGMEDVIVRKGI